MMEIKEPVLNIIVIGFHHKKGCQVEYCYPELIPGCPTELPVPWKHLPALALPDGSHNYHSDTIFFHLPGLSEDSDTVYAISCFRQISVEQVTQKTEDMTRSSVQKSVCVLCRVPLFGRLAIKMELVVKAWFLQGDFSQTSLLEDAYKHLNSCPVHIEQILEGINSARLVESWRHKALVLVKLVLLRRRVLFSGAAAGTLSASMLALLSLLPQCLTDGLTHAASFRLSKPLSPCHENRDEPDEAIEATEIIAESISIPDQALDLLGKEPNSIIKENDELSQKSFESNMLNETEKSEVSSKQKDVNEDKTKPLKNSPEAQQSPTLPRDMSVDGLCNLTSQIDLNECGFPLPLFEDGYLCLPYLCLQYIDLLSDPSVEAFMVGASNVLFKQKRQLFDVIIDLNDMRIETSDLLLRRQLTLSTEDLRFADHVVRHCATQGDAWIRDQFSSYILYLLRTSLLPEGSREIDPYNAQFMSAFKATPAYGKWLKSTNDGGIEAFANLAPLHPFAGQLSVADMKLRLAHTMSTTEGGRKVSAAVASTGRAVASTGRAVASTGRAVGGALSSARGAVSSWWSGLIAAPDQDQADQPDPPADNPTDIQVV